MKASGNRKNRREANRASVQKVERPEEQRRRLRIWALRAALLIGSLVLAMALTEAAVRAFFREKLPVVENERSLLYNYHPTLGWFPAANTTRTFSGSRTITVTHNSQGFRSPEPVTNSKPTMIVLGDSFVWGFDVEASERFTEKLQSRHPEWNIYNLGVSGYGTDQELLLLDTYFPIYKPAAVVLVFSSDNDADDNCRRVTRSGDYKPYFKVTGPAQIQLQGVPVPKSEHVILSEHRILSHLMIFRLFVHALKKRPQNETLPGENPTLLIIRAMRDYVEAEGAFFGVAVQEGSPDQGVKDFMTHFKIPWVSLSATSRYPTLGAHWTPRGHDEVCDAIEGFLAKARQKQ